MSIITHSVDENDAIKLMVHHLELVISLFENTPQDINLIFKRIDSEMGEGDLQNIAKKFVTELDNYYERLADRCPQKRSTMNMLKYKLLKKLNEEVKSIELIIWVLTLLLASCIIGISTH